MRDQAKYSTKIIEGGALSLPLSFLYEILTVSRAVTVSLSNAVEE
jgi:hypothetical protein